jgi:hypothetical protein
MRVQGWFEGGMNLTTAYLSDVIQPSSSIFVTITDDIYIDTGWNGRIDKLSMNTEQRVSVMSVNGPCFGVFIDIEDNLYCSIQDHNQVVKKSLKNNTDTTIVAGNGLMGSKPNQLDRPGGIFVDISFDLYVADTYNNRIQRFRLGDVNGVTIVMKGLTQALNRPNGIVLDADGYIFIADTQNSRIVGQGPDGFRCLVGCQIAGPSPNNLAKPATLSFDTFGNIFVADTGNHRIQKFFLKNNFCGNLSMTEPQFTSFYFY